MSLVTAVSGARTKLQASSNDVDITYCRAEELLLLVLLL